MNNILGRSLLLVGASLALAATGSAQGHRDDRHYGGGRYRANPPKALDHQFLDLFRGRGHLRQDRRNYEHQQRDRYEYGYGGYSNGYGFGYNGGGYSNRRGYDDHGYSGRRGHDDRRDSHGRRGH